MPKKVLIAAGGTGGHVFPAIGLSKQLQKLNPDIEVLFVGGGLSTNRYFDQNAFPHRSIDCGTFSRKSFVQCLASLKNIGKGFLQSRNIISEYKPDLIVGFGSYHTLPVLMAARFARCPYVLHEQNSVPGKVIRLFSTGSVLTGVYFPTARAYLKGKTQQMTMPLREGFSSKASSKAQARQHYGLEPAAPVLLVFGGSQGARFINELIPKTLAQLSGARIPQLQVLHFTGSPALTPQIKQLYDAARIPSVVKDFEHRMDLAWRASDLMVSRAGAGTIAEQIEFEVPGILIPYPLAADNHQDSNADFMVRTVGGALKVSEGHIEPSKLASMIEELLTNDGAALDYMQQAISLYKRSDRSKDFVILINQILSGGAA